MGIAFCRARALSLSGAFMVAGDNPVHEAARSGVSKTLMSVPISAMMTAAVCFHSGHGHQQFDFLAIRLEQAVDVLVDFFD